jgi:DNA-binding CsgD family transcriptional regulator
MKIITGHPIKERNKRVIEMIHRGLSYEEIGGREGITRSMVSYIALSHGIARRPNDVNKEKWAI